MPEERSTGAAAEKPADWDAVVSDASRHIDERRAAESASAARQKPKDPTWKLIALGVAVVAVLGWDVVRWHQPVEPMPAAQERVNLALAVVDVVEAVEDFREEHGRLPTPLEVDHTAHEDVEYVPTAAGYRVVVHGDVGSLTYDGTVDVEAWMSERLSSEPTGDGA